jgi:hypothetical protein
MFLHSLLLSVMHLLLPVMLLFRYMALFHNYRLLYRYSVLMLQINTPVDASILNPAGNALNVPPVAPVVVSVVVPVGTECSSLTVAVGDALTVTCAVVVPLHGAVP